MIFRLVLFPFIFSANVLFGQSYNAQPDSALIQALKYHVYSLADDSMEGRMTGSEGEKKAYRYISNEFREIQLSYVMKNNSYLQEFSFVMYKKVDDRTALKLNWKDKHAGESGCCQVSEDFYPLGYSENKSVKGKCVDVGYGIVSTTHGYDDYKGRGKLKGKIFFINISTPEGINPHSSFGEFLDLRPRVEMAIEKGAAAVIFYAAEDSVPEPDALLNKNIRPCGIPVVFLDKQRYAYYKGFKKLYAELTVELIDVVDTGNNVAGMIDNNAATTIVIGAHYDHLGYGEEGSLYRGEKAIHNGADDNASGVALLIELARKLKSSDLKNNNYVFAAFSGEELGLYGSKKFVEQFGEHTRKINYMLNFDMVGRLNPVERNLQVNGYGTSPSWKILQKIPADSIRIKTSDSGTGPSDHTSFYLKDIPVLHFFTGAHDDYHKPSDDAERVNYSGIASILNLTYALIDSLDDDGKIPFTPVAADTSQATPKFTVTLGVIPDYMFTGEGMRIDGVTDGKPAAKAGLQKGDVVIQLGNHKVSDLMTYMEALSRFKKGDSAKVVVMREQEKIEFNVTF
ncbi:MAG TPA: M20/M25/M40 family metallo-hydrolase [Chitinophagales bacterium]|nr:M20/M25/M40 family metallo-hydrolase [Chitinophagales bacterium]